MIVALVGLLLATLTFVFIVYPLFRQRSPSTKSVKNAKLQELYSKLDTTYSMLKELEFDHRSGVLTDEDYHDLEARYKRKAIAILKDIDDISKLKKGTEVGEEI